MKSRRCSGSYGFSVLELTVAVFMIAVMTAVVMPHLLGAAKTAQSVACAQNQQNIRAAMTEYEVEYHHYPTGNTDEQLQALLDARLLNQIPQEPDGGHYLIGIADSNGVEVSCDVHGSLRP